MKLCRLRTDAGIVPALVDAEGTPRSLAGILPDITAAMLSNGDLARLGDVDAASLPAMDGRDYAPVLADIGNGLASRLGLTFTLPAPLIEVYRGFGIDLERFNGDDSWQLPLPGRFILDRNGIIDDVEVHPDYTVRPEPDETVARLRRLLGR